ncbi:MAG: hypothetical protein H5T92_03280 [Synergistales bacterium]|nr:hypothetical protein [Synergistales bacterium]
MWAASGELALIQRVQEQLSSAQVFDSLREMRDIISGIVCQCVSTLIQLDFRSRFCGNNPDQLLGLHQADFVFSQVTASSERLILHVLVNGTSEWIIDRPFATGNGDMFAYALLRKYHGTQLSMDQASVLVYKVIEEAIDVGAYGLGYPIDVWHITKSLVKRLCDDELAALRDQAEQLRQMELSLLTNHSPIGRINPNRVSDIPTPKSQGHPTDRSITDPM